MVSSITPHPYFIPRSLRFISSTNLKIATPPRSTELAASSQKRGATAIPSSCACRSCTCTRLGVGATLSTRGGCWYPPGRVFRPGSGCAEPFVPLRTLSAKRTVVVVARCGQLEARCGFSKLNVVSHRSGARESPLSLSASGHPEADTPRGRGDRATSIATGLTRDEGLSWYPASSPTSGTSAKNFTMQRCELAKSLLCRHGILSLEGRCIDLVR